MTRSLLQSEGGVVALGAVVDLGPAAPMPHAPEVEDHEFTPHQARLVSNLHPAEYLELLNSCARGSLEELFGPEIERRKWKFAVDRGRGSASLGCLRPASRPDLEINQWGALTLRLNEWDRPAYVPVTDIGFFDRDQSTINANAVDDTRRRLRRGVPVVVMLGLARAFQAQGDDRERHWLQVNGLCLEDRPLGSIA